jgi:hypothetical protein
MKSSNLVGDLHRYERTHRNKRERRTSNRIKSRCFIRGSIRLNDLREQLIKSVRAFVPAHSPNYS